MPNQLTRFWREFKPSEPPFVHPRDIPTLMRNSRWSAHDDPKDFQSYLNSSRFGDPEDNRLHLALFPVPYVGNLDKAEIVILLLNPGFEHSDYWADTVHPEYRARLELNLKQEFKGIEFPFLGLDPNFAWHGGFMWWESKLRGVLREIASKHFGNSYLSAMRDLSRRLACVELVPYHSKSFRDHALIDHLESARHACKYVEESLVPLAAKQDCTLIATRRVKDWNLPSGMPNVLAYEGWETRQASLNLNSRGGRAILRHCGI